jgi:hypothetical protein
VDWQWFFNNLLEILKLNATLMSQKQSPAADTTNAQPSKIAKAGAADSIEIPSRDHTVGPAPFGLMPAIGPDLRLKFVNCVQGHLLLL